MDTCNLCENKYFKLFKLEEKVLGTQLSSIINFIFGDHQVDFPPKFLICTECSLALKHTEVLLERLSKALPNTRNFQKDLLNSVLLRKEHNESNEELENHQEEQTNKEADSSKKQNTSIEHNIDNWTFYCTHCEFTSIKPNIYKKHLINKHQVDNPRIYQCMYCQEAYQRINAIQNHIACMHYNKPRPKRQRRKTIAIDAPSLLSNKPIEGQLENETSMVNTTIEDTPAVDPNAPYEFDCTQCKYKTVHPKFFKKHMKIKHQIEDSRIYKCKRCPSTYARQFALQNHIAYEHENKPKPKLQRRKSVVAAGLEANTTGDKEDLIYIKMKQEKPKLRQEPEGDAEERGEEVMNYESDTQYQNGNTSINSIADEQQNQKEYAFQTPQKRKRNHLSSSEMSITDWIFQCSYCDFESVKRKKYKAHVTSQHGVIDADIYKCLYCAAAYERYGLLQNHVTNKHSIDLTTMSDTPAIYSDSSQDQSAKKRRTEETPKKAKQSKHIVSSQDDMTDMKMLNSEKSQQKETCVVCGKSYSSVDKLREHMDKQHGGDQIKNCPNCDAQFRSMEKYEAHLFSERCLDTKLACQYPGCPKRFSKRSKMQQHMHEKHPDLIS